MRSEEVDVMAHHRDKPPAAPTRPSDRMIVYRSLQTGRFVAKSSAAKSAKTAVVETHKGK